MKQSSCLTLLFMTAATLALSACKQPTAVAPALAINQGDVCEVKGWQYDNAVQAGCMPGQKIIFAPDRFGNEQLPILFAAVNCDMRYAIALTNGGVACIYEPTNQARTAKAPAK